MSHQPPPSPATPPNVAHQPPLNRPPAPEPGNLPLFFLANLLAVYLSGMILAAVQWKLSDKDIAAHGTLRTIIMDVLQSPFALLSRLLDDFMFQFRGFLGEIGSFYVFVVVSWAIVLGLSIAFVRFSRRYLATLTIAMASAAQAVVVSMMLVNDWEQQNQPQQAAPAAPGGMQQLDPRGGQRNFIEE